MSGGLIFSDTTILARSPEQVSGDIDGQVVLLSIENGQYYDMNEVGSRIWELLESPLSVAQLIELLLAEFDVPATTCRSEVVAFLQQLYSDNLIREESTAA